MKTATGRSRSSGRIGLVVVAFFTVFLCLAAAPGGLLAPLGVRAQAPSPPTSPSPEPGSKVTDILQHLYKTVTDVVEYQQDLEIHRTSPYMAQPFLPPYLEGGVPQPVVVARATFRRSGRWELTVRWLSKGKDLLFTSDDGYNLEFVSEKPDFTDLPLTPVPAPTLPAPGASPAADASPGTAESPTPAPAMDAAGPGPGDKEIYRYHPLTLIWPFVFKPLATNQEPYRLRDDEPVLGRSCWVVERNSGDMIMRIWVDQENYSVLQIQYTDPRDGGVVTGQFRSFWDMEDGMRSYRTLDVSKNGKALFSVSTLSEPTILTNRDLTGSRSPRAQASTGPSSTTKGPVVIHQYWERVRSPFTITLWITVVVLLIGLVYFGGRYILFMLARAEFSRDLILLEAEDGPVGVFLKEQGYVVTRCSMEVLTEERKHVGKRLGTVLPRAVIVAPESFGLIKNYLFLLRAYVEEGGRVLVLRQSASCAKELPFQAYFVPYSHDGRLSLSVRHNILKRLTVKDAETRTGKLLPKEMYVEVNQRKMDTEFIQALNKSTGVRAVLLGVVRQLLGEFILCQFDLVADLEHPKVTLGKALLLDIIDYTQGVKPEKKKPAAS